MLFHTTTFDYDTQGRLTVSSYPDETQERIVYVDITREERRFDALNRQSVTFSDYEGRPVRQINAAQSERFITYDEEGRKIEDVDPLGRVVTMRYDQLGRLIETTEPVSKDMALLYEARVGGMFEGCVAQRAQDFFSCPERFSKSHRTLLSEAHQVANESRSAPFCGGVEWPPLFPPHEQTRQLGHIHMSLNDAKFVAAIPTDEQLALIPGLTRIDLETQLEKVLADPQKFNQRALEVGSPVAVGECSKIPFGLSFFDVLALKGHIEVCVGACWKAEASACLEVFGNEVACRSVTLDCHGAETTLIDFGIEGLAWLKVRVGARGGNICFYLKGSAQFLHWREEFDETLFCVVPLATLDA